MKQYRLYIFDLDGTLYRGAQVLPFALETLAALRKRGALVRYLTNNSGQTRDYYLNKLSGMGFDVAPDEIYSSAIGAAHFCAEKGIRSAFYVGEPGLRETLSASGIDVVNQEESGHAQAQAVVAGICRSFTFRWLNSALQQIMGGAQFLATNTDATYPIEDGRVEPGAGAIVASIQTASGMTPVVIGKPNPLLIQLILGEAGIPASEALAVGDRYETDILSARNAGVDALLVLTGVTKVPRPAVACAPDLRELL